MKIYTIALMLLIAGIIPGGCSKPTAEESKEELEQTKGEWTHEQTNKAIDVYLDGLKQEEELLNKNLELRRQLKFFDENRCSRIVLQQRRAEIDSARNSLEKKRAEIKELTR